MNPTASTIERRENPAQGQSDTPFVILISPNLSEQMGGEAIKSLQIYLELEKLGVPLHQITHARVRKELTEKFPQIRASYIEDDRLQKFCWRSRIFRPLVSMIFHWRSANIACKLLEQHPGAVIHYTGPVSPVVPMFRTPGGAVLIGPVNGNIHHPPAFRHRESKSDRIRRVFHKVAQKSQKWFFPGRRSADLLLVAGSQRTRDSLLMAGCKPAQLQDSLDSGVEERLATLPRITHTARNLRFVHNGRMVPHKGADLIIRAMARTKNPVELDIIGRGPHKEHNKQLVQTLGLTNRVHFIEWIEDHSKLPEIMRQYRAFVFPSLAEANGIVVQEAMALGLPVICVDWGGPALLVTDQCGVLIKPEGEEYVIDELARAMDRLSEDFQLAESMSIAARERAISEGYLWPDIARQWVDLYRRLAQKVSGAASVQSNKAAP